MRRASRALRSQPHLGAHFVDRSPATHEWLDLAVAWHGDLVSDSHIALWVALPVTIGHCEIMNARDLTALVHLLGFMTGVVLYAMLGVMTRRRLAHVVATGESGADDRVPLAA